MHTGLVVESHRGNASLQGATGTKARKDERVQEMGWTGRGAAELGRKERRAWSKGGTEGAAAA